MDTTKDGGARNIIAEYGVDVKKGQAQDFKRWLSENESQLAAACPKGIE